MSPERISLIGTPLREDQLKFRLLWIGIFSITLLFAGAVYPQNTLSLRALNRVVLMAVVWNLLVFFTPLARKLGSAFDAVTVLMDVVFITWIVRVTGGFQSEFGILYFVELVLAAIFLERLQLLLGFLFSALGLCSSILSFRSGGPSGGSGDSGGFLIRIGRWRPEDLSALGVRAVTLVAVYLIGYVGRTLRDRRPVVSSTLEIPSDETSVPTLVKSPPVVESKRTTSHETSKIGEQLSIISHELRSPLTILRAYTDLLMDPNRENGTEEIASKIDTEVTQLSDMISNLGAIVDERAAPPVEAMKILNLVPLLQSLLERHQSLSDRHEMVFLCDRAEIPVRGDRLKLARAFSNLIGNAVKYSPQGGRIDMEAEVLERHQIGFLTAGASPADANQFFAVVRVRDSGMGMSAQAVSSAFEKFERFDMERTRGIPGTGLGLYLTRQIVEQHLGAIHLDSLEGRGTTVTVALPLALKGETRG